ncbi:hypothetical protein [uncultured Flavobacterium sp.]|uniref:DUF6712 family protein n=1 Tax=uncultured Flavobacterium sp. TaxID=165435 RepID=UPI0025CE2561|nr:hypothetical protein [uncultured Flavobacterium sp.]
MQPLITRADIALYRQISKTPHDDKLKEAILDAQLLDLQPLLGEKLYNKIVSAPEIHEKLMTGGPYVHDGIEYMNYGAKMVLAYFAYARYMMFSSVIDTPFSVVEKLSDTSKPVDASFKKTAYHANREAAMKIWDNVRNYLVRTGEAYYKDCFGKAKAGSSFRISKIT